MTAMTNTPTEYALAICRAGEALSPVQSQRVADHIAAQSTRIAELEAFKVNATQSYEDAARRIAALEGGLRNLLADADAPYGPCLRHEPRNCAKCAARTLLGGGQ